MTIIEILISIIILLVVIMIINPRPIKRSYLFSSILNFLLVGGCIGLSLILFYNGNHFGGVVWTINAFVFVLRIEHLKKTRNKVGEIESTLDYLINKCKKKD